jgi:hypothetical protein
MNQKERVEKDIVMFEDNIKKIREKNIEQVKIKIIESASQYYEDSKYYLKKKDYFTAFGCINYGHGLLDSLIKF